MKGKTSHNVDCAVHKNGAVKRQFELVQGANSNDLFHTFDRTIRP